MYLYSYLFTHSRKGILIYECYAFVNIYLMRGQLNLSCAPGTCGFYMMHCHLLVESIILYACKPGTLIIHLEKAAM